MSFLPYPPSNTTEAVSVLKQDINLAHEIVHGDDEQDVLTENGLVPSFSKVIKNVYDEVQAATGVDVSLRSDLANVNSNVLVGGVPAKQLGNLSKSFVNALDYLVSPTTDSGAVAAALAISNNVFLPNIGRPWVLTGITVPVGGMLFGQNTDISTTANATCISHSEGSTLKCVNIVGSGKASGLTSQVLVQVPAVGRSRTIDCKLSNAGGKAWWVTNFYLDYQGSDLINCDLIDNLVGAEFGNRGEYCLMMGCNAKGNTEAVVIDGGNQRIIGNSLSNNTRGLWVKTGTNGDHSLVNDNIINHCTIGIQCDTLTAIDMSFNGNMLYYSPIVLNGCEGVMFNGGTISSTSPIIEQGAINCVFDGVYFPQGINNTPNSGSPSMVIYKNSKFDRAEAILQAQDLDNSFAKSRRVSDVSVAAGANTIATYTQRTQNSISANSGFTYKLLFDSATGVFSALTNWVDRGFEIDVSATLTISRTAADVDISKVFVEIVDSTSNDVVYGSFRAGRKITLAGDIRCHTYSFAGKIPRADFKVLITNQSADSVTIKSNTAGSIRSEINVSGW